MASLRLLQKLPRELVQDVYQEGVSNDPRLCSAATHDGQRCDTMYQQPLSVRGKPYDCNDYCWKHHSLRSLTSTLQYIRKNPVTIYFVSPTMTWAGVLPAPQGQFFVNVTAYDAKENEIGDMRIRNSDTVGRCVAIHEGVFDFTESDLAVIDQPVNFETFWISWIINHVQGLTGITLRFSFTYAQTLAESPVFIRNRPFQRPLAHPVILGQNGSVLLEGLQLPVPLFNESGEPADDEQLPVTLCIYPVLDQPVKGMRTYYPLMFGHEEPLPFDLTQADTIHISWQSDYTCTL